MRAFPRSETSQMSFVLGAEKATSQHCQRWVDLGSPKLSRAVTLAPVMKA